MICSICEKNYNHILCDTNATLRFIKIERVHIGERIRDMIYYNKKLYLYLEDTASIAEVSIK